MAMTLATAKALPLMGRAVSWDCHGGKPLGAVPDDVLHRALLFFRYLLCQHASYREKITLRMIMQIEAIHLVLVDREASSPQQVLSL